MAINFNYLSDPCFVSIDLKCKLPISLDSLFTLKHDLIWKKNEGRINYSPLITFRPTKSQDDTFIHSKTRETLSKPLGNNKHHFFVIGSMFIIYTNKKVIQKGSGATQSSPEFQKLVFKKYTIVYGTTCDLSHIYFVKVWHISETKLTPRLENYGRL